MKQNPAVFYASKGQYQVPPNVFHNLHFEGRHSPPAEDDYHTHNKAAEVAEAAAGDYRTDLEEYTGLCYASLSAQIPSFHL